MCPPSKYDHPVVDEGFAPDALRQHVMAEAIKFEAEMLMAWDSRSQPLPTQLEYPLPILTTTNTTHSAVIHCTDDCG